MTAADAMLRNGAFLLDVREPAEVAICALPGGRHVPMRQVPDVLAELPEDRPLLVLCHVGVRSRAVTQYLRANGRTNAVNIAGGIAAWAEQIDPTLARY